MTLEPVIKWSGSKRSQASEIVRRFPREIDTYYEPFCGGASVLRRLLMTPSVKVRRFVCSDINWDLIGLWNEIKDNPDWLAKRYAEMWRELNGDGDLERKKRYFNAVREEFNETRNSDLFLFIMRTTTNGMPRYNARGDFNNSFHVTRNGIEPRELAEILRAWSVALNHHGVEFICRDYSETKPQKDDFCYCDSPYAAVKGNSMYNGGIELSLYFDWLRKLKCKWAFSFDGKTQDEDYTYQVPTDLYVEHCYINSGNSSFRRVIGKNKKCEVHESLYLNYKVQENEENKREQMILL